MGPIERLDKQIRAHRNEFPKKYFTLFRDALHFSRSRASLLRNDKSDNRTRQFSFPSRPRKGTTAVLYSTPLARSSRDLFSLSSRFSAVSFSLSLSLSLAFYKSDFDRERVFTARATRYEFSFRIFTCVHHSAAREEDEIPVIVSRLYVSAARAE